MLKDDFQENFKCGFSVLTSIDGSPCGTAVLQNKKKLRDRDRKYKAKIIYKVQI